MAQAQLQLSGPSGLALQRRQIRPSRPLSDPSTDPRRCPSRKQPHHSCPQLLPTPLLLLGLLMVLLCTQLGLRLLVRRLECWGRGIGQRLEAQQPQRSRLALPRQDWQLLLLASAAIPPPTALVGTTLPLLRNK